MHRYLIEAWILLLDAEESRCVYKSGNMGISIEVYRSRIGTFNGARWKMVRNTETRNSEINIKVWFLGLVIVTLLIVGGVEQNPALLSKREGIEIF
jgi:hypothetical protein